MGWLSDWWNGTGEQGEKIGSASARRSASGDPHGRWRAHEAAGYAGFWPEKGGLF